MQFFLCSKALYFRYKKLQKTELHHINDTFKNVANL